ncbi:MAG: hypothetical protein RL318_2309 [Fibrobacterota bacterium]
MKAMWATGLFLAGLAGAGDIRDASLIGDRNGWRMEFDCSEEPLTRVWQPEPGIVRVEFQNFHAASVSRAFGENPWFVGVNAVAGKNAVYDFKVRPGVTLPDGFNRAWDGRRLRVTLSRTAASQAFVEAVKVMGTPSMGPSATAAAIETSGELLKASLVSIQDQEVLELHFSKTPLKAALRSTPNGLKLDLELDGARLNASKLGSPRGDGWNVRGLSATREGRKETLRIELGEPVKSAVLNRMGNVVTVRMRRETPASGVRVWESGKNEVFGGIAIPVDEMQSLGKARVDVSSRIFTPATSAPSVVISAPVGQDKSTRDAEILEVERRKSQEFALKQKLDEDAKQSVIDEKNRIVYHTFGVRDPFIPLDPGDAENGLNIDQMKVVGIIFSKVKRMAVLEHVTQAGLSVALKEGDPIQNGRVSRIEKDRVVFTLEEFGQTREFALRLQAPKGDRT